MSSLVVDGASQIAVMGVHMNSQVTQDTCISCHKYCCVFLSKEGGFSGFYRGLMPTVVGMAPYAGKLKPERGSSVHY